MTDPDQPNEPPGASPRPLRVGAWPARLLTNEYNAELYRHLGRSATIVPVEADRQGLRAARRGEIDILHVHWIDRVLWQGGRLASVKRMALMSAIVAAVRRRGGRVVWTAHDPVPHEMKGTSALSNAAVRFAWRRFERYLLRSLDGVLVLSESHEPMLRARHPFFAARPFGVTPHPHYRGVYPDHVDREAARRELGLPPGARVLVCLGSIRPYKGVVELLAAFAGVDDPDARLVLAGKLDGDDVFNRSVERAAAADPRVRADLGFVPDDRIQIYLRAADAAALPFTSVTNSGSAILALSYDLPIIVPDEPIFRDLEARVGADWLARFPLPLDGPKLAAAFDRLTLAPRHKPTLAGMNWAEIADATLSFFKRLRAG